MGVIKLENLDISNITFKNDNILYNGEPLFLQTSFQQIKPYGLPKKSDYCKTDDGRMYYQVPVTVNNIINILKELNKTLSSNILKEGKEQLPASIKFKFNRDTVFSLIDDITNEITIVEYDSIDDLDKKMRFFYDFRFILSIRPYKYMGRSGVTLLASHVQAVIKNSITPVTEFI